MAEAHAFGAMFRPTNQDRALAEAIAGGTLHLHPHKPWKLPGEPTWREDPFKETNWTFQYQTLRWLDPLRRRAAAGDSHFIDTWLKYATSWIERNPPGRGVSRYSWADMVDGARALTFSFALPVIEEHRPDALPLILASLEEHGAWLEDPAHIKTGNHALQQHQGLLVLGAVLQRPDWVELARERCVEMVHIAYDDEGINEEGALQYHHMNYSWWNLMRRRFEITMGSSPQDFDRVNRAPIGMAHATRPDGRVEMIGDTEEFKMGGVDHPAVRYVHSSGREGVPPRERVKVYSRGYAFGRSTWGDARESFADASFYSLRFGSQKQIHGHNDGMALTLFANGESFLRDAGKFTYDVADPVRKYVVSRAGHNSVSLDGIEYERATEVVLDAHSIDESAEFYRLVDRGYPGVTITRRVLVSLHQRLAVVVDDIESARAVRARQWWHFAEGASHRREEGSVFVRSGSNRARLFRLDGSDSLSVYEGSTSPLQGWYSPNWREKVPVRTLAFEPGPGQSRMLTLLCFDGTAERAEAELVDVDSSWIAATVSLPDGRSTSLLLGEQWGTVTPGRASVEDFGSLIAERNASSQVGEQ
ncbi:hypothetical protein L332_11765 [Agrococcus pavilionensis RW1]|uniref:Uncharacterized protein n=1 Tax=Agrococcus pavilionensis RW1 TaxID=1330458 RepID=U1LSN0_9MICO|nr:heparinase II/III family protein [Agrococcus pavilionensis]ERG65112.1 hypothetical protein L332_11765 [Agrococcus pavilionensis RW1]